jgi:three-Cys-motif partner protein
MSDNLPTIWTADPHTLAKHAILARYLGAWFPIITRQSQRIASRPGTTAARQILFIDAFAGPGVYANGKPGSPIIALQSAMQHAVKFPAPVRLVFIEKDPARFKSLRETVDREKLRFAGSNNVIVDDPTCGDCDAILSRQLAAYAANGVKFGPALAFLDQFGFSGVSMELVRQILAYPECEVLTYIDFKGMNRWIQDETKWGGFDRAFGSEAWKPAIKMAEPEQRAYLLSTYVAGLKTYGNATYVCHFSMFGLNGQLLYWLIFCTNSLRGLEEMKKAMWAVDKSGEFRFSDREIPEQLSLLDAQFSQEWLAEHLCRKLARKTMTVSAVKEFVLVQTPCYLFKSALKTLEKDAASGFRVVSTPPGRRSGDFHDEAMKLRFGDAPLV